MAEPLSIFVSSYGTGVKSDDELLKIVKNNFDLRPGRIVRLVLVFVCGYCLVAAISFTVDLFLIHIISGHRRRSSSHTAI